jgi:thiol-disulfide isomerase/thioredoxin
MFSENHLLLILILVVLSLFIYCYFYKNEDNRYPSEDFEEKVKQGKIILYHAKWCGHCNTFLPKWNQLKNKYNDIYIFEEYEEKDMSKEQLSEITGFPTIFYVYGNNKYKIQNRDNLVEEIKNLSN